MAMVLVSEDILDPTLTKLRQVQDLSPNSSPRCAPSSPSSEERWADIAIDNVGTYEVAEDAGLFVEGFEELDSVGSKHHATGRCKPCAFYHTKGCQSGAGCQFCHRCPAHEKQRRKRLRRQLCNSIIHGGFDGRGGRGQGDRSSMMKDDERQMRVTADIQKRAELEATLWQSRVARRRDANKAGHARISSDTTSTCSGWVSNSEGQYGHSRHPSTSSQATSVYEIGECANMANLGYVRSQPEPVYGYQNTQPQLMSSQMDYQNVMRPMEESWSENPQNEDLDTMPVLEAQALAATAHERAAFPSSGDVLNSMPKMPAIADMVSQKEPPPPPPGVPKVADARLQQQQLCLPLADGANMNYQHEHAQMQAGMSSPVGYISCGGYQYAIVPVPVNQYEMDAGVSSPIHQQEAVVCSPQAHQLYHMEQSWETMPYQSVQDFPASPVAVGNVMGGSQWW